VPEEFANHDAITGKILFVVADFSEALIPDVLIDGFSGNLPVLKKLLVHQQHQGIFVLTAVEDAEPAPFGKGSVAAPEIIVVEGDGPRSLEGGHLTHLRMDAAHDVVDGAILFGGIHRLEDQQQAQAIPRA
jgi:hypothetical protein